MLGDNPSSAFPHPFSPYSDIRGLPTARTLGELSMVKVSYQLRSKPSWWTKYKNPEIRGKWKAEGVQEAGLTEKQIEYVLDELRGYETLRDEETGAQVSCFDGIWESDQLFSQSFRSSLIAETSKLEEVPEDQKDWHPNSDDLVLDLVHPSLYPVVYGRTIAKDTNDSTSCHILQAPVMMMENRRYPYNKVPHYAVSTRFQWLPTDFSVSEDGQTVHALGYINNLHPSHSTLYRHIESAIKAFIPLFSRVLTDLKNPLPHRITDSYSRDDEGYDEEPEQMSDEDDAAFDARYDEWEDAYEEREANRPITLPDAPEAGYTGELEKHRTLYNLNGSTLQIIVKLANIHLTPNKPSYAGGSWHVEGMLNESIVASGIYYYDEENVTESQLSFRMAVSGPEDYLQNDEWGAEMTWGLSRESDCNQVLGTVVTKKNRALAFPNLHQHCVLPFELRDKANPGHRKILVLFLVDPNVPVPSTTTVPPQQKEWIEEAMFDMGIDQKAPLNKLPVELKKMIMEEADHLMSLEEAKEIRLSLMSERTAFVERNEQEFFTLPFNMCEH